MVSVPSDVIRFRWNEPEQISSFMSSQTKAPPLDPVLFGSGGALAPLLSAKKMPETEGSGCHVQMFPSPHSMGGSGCHVQLVPSPHSLHPLTHSPAELPATRPQRWKGPRTCTLRDALKFFVEEIICEVYCGSRCAKDPIRKVKCPVTRITDKLFNPRTWSRDTDKLPHEVPGKQGARTGGHFLYLSRKVRELAVGDASVKMNEQIAANLLRNVPSYNHEAPSEEYDAFRMVIGRLRQEIQDSQNRNLGERVRRRRPGASAQTNAPHPTTVCAPLLSHPAEGGAEAPVRLTQNSTADLMDDATLLCSLRDG